MTQLTDKEAYQAMFAFLQTHYASTGSDDIGALLGGMSLLVDGMPADPAVAKEWADAITAATSGRVSADLDLKTKPK